MKRIGDEGRKLKEAMRTAQARNGRQKYSLRAITRALRGAILGIVAGKGAARALAVGRFRLSGEVHHWMYDRFNLSRELTSAGFVNPQVRDTCDSAIEGWKDFYLDCQPDGTATKPDLFFMEAMKPIRL